MLIGSVMLLWLSLTLPVQAQWQNGNLTVRTNGNVFQSGDQLKVEILALETIQEQFYTQVAYLFDETVEEKDDDGKTTEKLVERARKRPTSPLLDRMEKYQSLVLDDTFHFGEVSPTGRYTVQVSIFQAHTKKLLALLQTCVLHQDEASKPSPCETHLRSLKRANTELFLTFDGAFAKTDYTVLLLRNGRVVRHLLSSTYTAGPRELNLSSGQLEGTGGSTYDILIHDARRGISSTLARVTLPTF
ncbi:MAG: hypothetical protein HYR56_32225 [Acidobacteria bacterium]|nr:hypothetical protein [Acidobacteriota bacterium]MBI3424641.1 hypothetical protein [Acidobacteriota bacterium]